MPQSLTTLLSIQAFSDLANLLSITPQKLSYILYRSDVARRYRRFQIAKRSGAPRDISAPHPALARLQRQLATLLLDTYKPKPSVHSYVRGRSIHSNAARHVRKSYVLSVDLSDFFPSINFGRVRGMFMAVPYSLPPQAATWLAQIACFENQLPQGAPSSPIISNMLCGRLDSDLQTLAQSTKCDYTRYADDLTFSTSLSTFPHDLATLVYDGLETRTVLGQRLKTAIEGNGFEINPAKVRLGRARWHQEVTGLTVNRRVNVRRRYVRQIRAMLHALRKFGAHACADEHVRLYRSKNRTGSKLDFCRVLRGKLEFLRVTRGGNDFLARKFAGQLRALAPAYAQGLLGGPPSLLNGEQRDVFLCHASSDKKAVVVPIYHALERGRVTAWLDAAEIPWGGSLFYYINAGLKHSRYVLVCLSRRFLDRPWARRELAAAFSREVTSGELTVLPLLIGDEGDRQQILHELPLLADKRYINWTGDPNAIAYEILQLLSTERGRARQI